MTYVSTFVNSNTWVGCARETVRGTAQPQPTFWVPAVVLSPRVKSQIMPLEDKGDRGQMTDVWDVVGGPRWEEFQFKCLVHPDILPHLLRSILGSPDTVTAGPNGSYFHAFSLLNNDGAADQPPSYTWYDYDGLHLRTIRGGQTDWVQIQWLPEGLVQITARILGYSTTVSTTSLTASISTVEPNASWNTQASLNSVTTPTVTKGLLELSRHCQVIKTLGHQTPYSVFAGPLSIRGSLSFINLSDAELNTFLTYASVPLSLNSASITPNEGLVLDMASVKSEAGVEERGINGLITTTLDFVPLPNATDATAGGFSPIKATVQNFTSTVY